MWTAIIKAVGAIINPITKLFSDKNELKGAIKQAKLDKIMKGEASDAELDKLERENAGWMDDVSFGIALLPAVLCFCPYLLPHIEAGFTALEKMPLWYQLALGLMLTSVWGYRKIIGPIVTSIAIAMLKK